MEIKIIGLGFFPYMVIYMQIFLCCSSNSLPEERAFKLIWNSKAPPMNKVIAWAIVHGKV